jgi:hypothetical protein
VFVSYEKVTGKRISGDQPFRIEIDLPEGDYQAGCGEKGFMVGGKEAKQSIFFTVDEEGAFICKWSELPSNGGLGRGTSASAELVSMKAGGGVAPTESMKAKAPVQTKLDTPPAEDKLAVVPTHIWCSSYREVRDLEFVCDDFKSIDPVSPVMGCGMCIYAQDLLVKMQ